MTTTPTNPADELMAAQAQRRSTRNGAKNAATAETEATIPFSDAATLGMGESFDIGRAKEPLKLNLRAPVVRLSGKFRTEIRKKWRDVFLAAAVGDRKGKGVDTEKVAEFWTLRLAYENANREEYNRTQPDDVAKMPLLPIPSIEELQEEAQDQLDAFGDVISTYDFDKTGTPDGETAHEFDELCDTVWTLAQFDNPGVTRATLPALLADKLFPADFADLLRAMFRACSGSDTAYEADTTSVFTPR